MSDKRYQVFVSSTFKDLAKERLIAFNSILQAGCFPAGMENFPVLTGDSLKYIYQLIDESDFFLLILGGRYGSSRDESGVSYTHLEARYAQKTGKPIIALYPLDWCKLEDKESTPENITKLVSFIQEITEKFDGAKPWTAETLSSLVYRGVEQAIKDHPEAMGWVRADKVTPLSNKLDNHTEADELQKIIDSPQTFHIDIYEYNYIETYDIMNGMSKTKLRQKYASEDKALIDIFPFIAKDANAIKTKNILSFNNSIIRSVIGRHKTSTSGLSIDDDIARDVVGEMMMQGLLKRDEQNMFVVTDLGYRLYKKITATRNS